MKNYTNPSVRLLLFFLSISTFFACANGTQKLGMNGEATPLDKPLIPQKQICVLDSDIEYLLEGCGSTQEFREYLEGKAKGKDYREYVERNSKTEGMEPLEEAYSSDSIELLHEYFGNRLCINNIIIKNTRSEKDMNELRLGLSPILICLIDYIQNQQYNIGSIHEQKLGRKFIDALDLLLNKGVDVNQADFLGNTAILALTKLAADCIIQRPSSSEPFITFFEYMLNHLLEKGADPTRKTIKQNSAELCIEEFHREDFNNKNLERILNKIKTYAAKFKTSEEAKEGPSV